MTLDGFETTQEAARRLKVNQQRVRVLLKEGRLPGAIKVGSGNRAMWLIPKNVERLPPAGREKEEE